MYLYVIRHGDPTYNEYDELTERGKLRVAALAKRLARYDVDKIYTSPLHRARAIAQPTCALLAKPYEILEWANEDIYWKELAYEDKPNHGEWCFRTEEGIYELRSSEVERLEKNGIRQSILNESESNLNPFATICAKKAMLFSKNLAMSMIPNVLGIKF